LLVKEKEETDKLTALGWEFYQNLHTKIIKQTSYFDISASEKQKWILSNGGNNILGKGSFGTVVIGHNKETGEIVAVKLIDTHKDDRKQVKEINQKRIF